MDNKINEAALTKRIKTLVLQERYEDALKALDEIDVSKIRNISILCLVGEVYMGLGRYDEAEQVLLRVYEKKPNTRRILDLLTTLYIDKAEYSEAEYYYKEFIGVASRDLHRYILRYRLDKGKGERLSVLIDTLEKLKDYEYIEEWAYELATLYDASGETKKCIHECDEIVLWFGHGEYVDKAIALKCKLTGEPLPEMTTVEMHRAEEERLAEGNQMPDGETGEFFADDYENSIDVDMIQRALENRSGDAEASDASQENEIVEASKDADEQADEAADEILPELAEVERTEGDDKSHIAHLFSTLMFGHSREKEKRYTEWDADKLKAEVREEPVIAVPEKTDEQEPEQNTGAADIIVEDEVITDDKGDITDGDEVITDGDEVITDGDEVITDEDAVIADDEDNDIDEDEVIADDEDDIITDNTGMPETDADLLGQLLGSAASDVIADAASDDIVLEDDEEDDGEENDDDEDEVISDTELPVDLFFERKLADVPENSVDTDELIDDDDDDEEDVENEEADMENEVITADIQDDTADDMQDDDDDEDEDEISDNIQASDTVLDIFSSVAGVPSIKNQLAKTFTKFEDPALDKMDLLAPYDINFVVTGDDMSVKSQIAIGIAKALNTYGICDKSKLVRATADNLNGREFSMIFGKLSGGCLIIEGADRLDDRSVEIIEEFISQDNQDVAIVLEGEEGRIKALFKAHATLRSKFLNFIHIGKYDEKELVQLAEGYAKKKGYELSKPAATILKRMLRERMRDEYSVNYEDIMAIIEEAIASLEKRNMKNLFMTVLDNKYEEAAMFMLQPEDFDNINIPD